VRCECECVVCGVCECECVVCGVCVFGCVVCVCVCGVWVCGVVCVCVCVAVKSGIIIKSVGLFNSINQSTAILVLV